MNGAEDIKRALDTEGVFVSTSVGTSMFPMLRNRTDTVVIYPAKDRLKKFDVPLYCTDGKLILHRIIRVLDNGYDIRGDNCLLTEHAIPDECIIGVLGEFWRGDKKISLNSFSYRFYVRFWHYTFGFRLLYRKTRAFVGKLLRKLGLRK